MKSSRFFVVSTLVCVSFLCVGAEPLSLIVGVASVFGGGLLVAFKGTLRCKLFECCDAPYINPNFEILRNELRTKVFGQHIVLQNVVAAIETHWNGQPVKPLVMSFHGYTGCGKNYVASLIAENLYKNGMKSSFVHHIVASAEFPDISRIYEYEEKLRKQIHDAAQSCAQSLFIIDEVDKMPERLLSAIKSYMDYYQSVKGVDFRKSIFLLLSNKGASDILGITIAQHEAGKERAALRLNDFEGKVAHDSFNREGGLKMSEIISNHLIDHYLPFLPLERSHVEQCIGAYFELQHRPELARQKDKVKLVADQLKYFPNDNPIYSSSGCKRVAMKADLIIASNQQRREKHEGHDQNDEL
ncbi:unnamed protein product, partial [Mesorhabditis belari]|uniref:AAA+ ATPase domain-containing protein n=1 Tax=Mesorhabditis belari TaxID=2138241 RepID=A0AAF3EM40_9BILA